MTPLTAEELEDVTLRIHRDRLQLDCCAELERALYDYAEVRVCRKNRHYLIFTVSAARYRDAIAPLLAVEAAHGRL